MTHTYRIETGESGAPEVWIDFDSRPMIHQPHHPETEGFAPWDSVEAATEWAIEMTDKLNNPPAPPAKLEL